MTDERGTMTQPPVTGFPPSHAIATVAFFTGSALLLFPSMEHVDQLATVENVSRPLFPQYLTSVQLGLIRWFFVAAVLRTALPMALGPGYIRYTEYLPSSKLKKKVPIHVKGIRTAYSFTAWSWYLLGFHFFASGLIPLWHHFLESPPPPRWLLRWTLFSYHAVAPCALLVSCVVRYALWPNAIRNGKSTKNYKTFTSRMAHNANVGMVLMETAVLGRVPVTLSLVSIPILLESIYVVFSWMVRFQWRSSPESGEREAHFLYFFFDTTIPGLFASVAVAALWLTTNIFFLLFYAMSQFLFTGATSGGTEQKHEQEPVFAYNVAAMIVVLSLVCRFRD